jgi:hypothetical protein
MSWQAGRTAARAACRLVEEQGVETSSLPGVGAQLERSAAEATPLDGYTEWLEARLQWLQGARRPGRQRGASAAATMSYQSTQRRIWPLLAALLPLRAQRCQTRRAPASRCPWSLLALPERLPAVMRV